MSDPIEDVNIKDICRVCLETDFSESIYLEPGNEWLEQYEYCFGLTVHENDVPRQLCLTCAEHMKEFADFKKKCHDSHHHWKTIITEIGKCDSKDIKVKEEFDELLIKEEIQEENYFVKSDEIDPELNTVSDHIKEDFLNEYDETAAYDSGNRNVKKSKNTLKKENRNKNLKDNKNVNGNKNLKGNKRRKTKGNEVIETKSIIHHNKKGNKIFKGNKRRKTKDNEVIETKSNIHHCGLCDFSSSEVEKTKEHLKDHSAMNELICKICKYEGNDFADMVTHRYDHVPKGAKIFCHQCKSKRFHSVNRLQFHYRSDHLNKMGGWCAECNISFERYRAFRNHRRLKHEDVKKFICDHCGRDYLYRHRIVEHLETVFGAKNYVCDSCGSAFKRHFHLKLHMSTVHENEAVKCDHCGMTFKNKFRLHHHLKIVAKKKEFICKVCSKAFYFRASLKEHEFWHTGERPFPCEICDKRYKKKSELKTHLERHRGIRKHKCTDCPKDFVTLSQLKIHRAVHTGTRRHKCEECDRSFNAKKLLLAHCLTKHNKELGSKKV